MRHLNIQIAASTLSALPMMNRRKQQSGSILIIGTISMFVLFGFMGLAIDAGYMYFHKRRMQTAADAGALAGAQELMHQYAAPYSTVQTAALKDTSLNDFPNGGDVTVTVNMPPQFGAKAGQAGFVEVIIGQPQPTTFLQVLNISSTNVMARAVAGAVDSTACIYALDQSTNTSTQYGFSITGSTQVNMACGIYSNSNFSAVGGACVASNDISYVNAGGYTNSCGLPGLQPSGPTSDPMAALFPTAGATIATKNTCTYTNFPTVNPSDIVTLNPGVYCGGLNIKGTAVFNPGTYVISGGGITVTAGATLTGNAVTFFMTYPGTNASLYSPVKITGSGIVTLTAPTIANNPTNSPYVGVLFYQDPTVPAASIMATTSIIAGGGGSVYEGIIYFPTTDLQYTGSSTNVANSSAGYTILVGYDIAVSGGSVINSNYTGIGGNPFKIAVFAE